MFLYLPSPSLLHTHTPLLNPHISIYTGALLPPTATPTNSTHTTHTRWDAPPPPPPPLSPFFHSYDINLWDGTVCLSKVYSSDYRECHISLHSGFHLQPSTHCFPGTHYTHCLSVYYVCIYVLVNYVRVCLVCSVCVCVCTLLLSHLDKKIECR